MSRPYDDEVTISVWAADESAAEVEAIGWAAGEKSIADADILKVEHQGTSNPGERWQVTLGLRWRVADQATLGLA